MLCGRLDGPRDAHLKMQCSRTWASRLFAWLSSPKGECDIFSKRPSMVMIDARVSLCMLSLLILTLTEAKLPKCRISFDSLNCTSRGVGAVQVLDRSLFMRHVCVASYAQRGHVHYCALISPAVNVSKHPPNQIARMC